jgi:hypothetical protein
MKTKSFSTSFSRIGLDLRFNSRSLPTSGDGRCKGRRLSGTSSGSLKSSISITVLLVILSFFTFSGFTAAQDLVGIYRIDIPGSASLSTTREKIDGQTVQRTDTTTIGKGSQGAGTLEIKADGTYIIRDFLGYGKARSGRWVENRKGKFSDKGGVELLEAKSADYAPDQRSWYVFVNDDGQIEAREAPYTYYNKLRLTRSGGKSLTDNKLKSPVKNSPSRDNDKVDGQSVSRITVRSANIPPGKSRQWTVKEFQQFFEGKTREEVENSLGKPDSTSYKTWIFTGLKIVDLDDKDAVRTKAYISFTELTGGNVWHITFF